MSQVLDWLLPRAISGFVVLLQLGSVLMSAPLVTTKGQADVCDLCCGAEESKEIETRESGLRGVLI